MSVENPEIKLGYSEYCLFPDDGKRHEIIDGKHYMNPAPAPDHQSVSKYLQHYLFTQIELAGLGTIFNAPIDVQLSDFDIVQPDLIVVLKKSRAKITRTRVMGPPDLVVEIISPSSTSKDMSLKRRLYEQFGVSEYWIVHPRKRTVDQLMLRDQKYRKLLQSQTELACAVLPQVKVPLAEIWDK